MIRELKLCRADYEDLLACYLRMLLINLHRLDPKETQVHARHLAGDMDTAMQYFHEKYNTPISIEKYASEHGMSAGWFIRCFREYTGISPAQYILSLRISNAQTLLKTTDFNITEIAAIVGYENPLYFSRIFKKQNGVSPSEYRKQICGSTQI